MPIALPNALYFLRRIKFASTKVNFVNISYFLFTISFRPPRRLNPWRPSPPFRGRADGYGSLFKDSKEEPPSPFCEWPSPPRGRAMGYGASLEDLGACSWLREFIPKFGRRTPLARLFAWPSPPRGRALFRSASLFREHTLSNPLFS